MQDKNSVLRAQIQEYVFRQEDLENEAIRLRTDLGREKMENQKLSKRVKQLEVRKQSLLFLKYEPNIAG